jgi:small subunit ribosomal protein S6
MHKYETLFILHPDLPEAQVRETIDRTRRLIDGMEGRVADIHDWGLRELAYPIEKQTRGNYVLAEYEASSAVVNELERTMKLSDEVMRFVSVRVPLRSALAEAPDAATEEPDVDEADEFDAELPQEGN